MPSPREPVAAASSAAPGRQPPFGPFDAGFALGDVEVLPGALRIRHPQLGETRIEPKAMGVLLCLAAASGQVVSRDEILSTVWGGRYVTEHVLSRSVSSLRKALGDDARAPRVLETVHTRGFRLLEPVQPLSRRVPTPLGTGETAAPEASRSRAASRGRGWAAAAAASAVVALAAWALPRDASRGADVVVVPLTAQLGDEVDPALSPDGKRVAFAWNDRGGADYDLYVADATGGELPARSTAGEGREREPAWSADGRHVAFVRGSPAGHAVFVAPSHGGEERRVATLQSGDAADLEWATEGRRLLFFTDRPAAGAASAVVRLEVATGRRRWATRPPAGVFGDRDLAVSPDGRFVVFARASLPGMEDLWIAEVERRNERRLTHDGASINGVAWMPETGEVLFSSSRDGTSRLWRLSLAARAVPRLARGLPDGAVDPTYAPSARRLAFERRTFDTNVWRLALGGARTASAQRLSASTRWDAQPALTAGGRFALVSDRGGPPALWVGRIARARELRPLGLESRIVGRPAWSPDGRRVAVAEVEEGQADVVVVDVKSGRRWRAAATSANEVSPAFSADGRSVLYSSDAGGAWKLWQTREGQGSSHVPVLADGPVLGARVHGTFIYFVRPGMNGLWRAPLAGGAPARVPGSEALDPWADWDLAGDTLFVRPLASAARTSYEVAIGATASPTAVPLAGLPPAPFPGLGLAVDPAATELLFGALDGSDGDLLQVESYR